MDPSEDLTRHSSTRTMQFQASTRCLDRTHESHGIAPFTRIKSA